MYICIPCVQHLEHFRNPPDSVLKRHWPVFHGPCEHCELVRECLSIPNASVPKQAKVTR